MPSPAYFGQFGIATMVGAFAPELCEQVIEAMSAATPGIASVWNPVHGDRQTVSKRRTEFVHVLDEVNDAATMGIEVHRDALSSFFGMPLGALQPLKFVRYEEGDRYGVHHDTSAHPNAPAIIRARRLSVVVILNDQADEPEDHCYCGGRLTFHGLLDEQPWSLTGHALDAEAGLLVAFRPDLLHEVTPVTAGERHTLVTWFE